MKGRDSEPLLALVNVSYRIGDKTLLSNLSIEATERRIGIVGRNGSGKSTLARLLCGLNEPSSGSLTVAGVDVATDRYRAIRTVGMLFQNPDHQVIFPTVEEELAFGLEQLGQSRDEAQRQLRELLAEFGVMHWAEQSVSTLSQGQRHLVCLMAVILMKPKLVVLDEPFTGLDMPTTAQLSRLLEKLDASIVHVTHQIESLQEYNRILWLDNGELVMDERPTIVLEAYCAKMKQLGSTDAFV